MLAVFFLPPLRKVPKNGARRRQRQTNKGENDMIEGGKLERGKESNRRGEEMEGGKKRTRETEKEGQRHVNGREGVMEKEEKGGEKKEEKRD